MTDKITCMEVPKEILTEVVNRLEFDRYCEVANVLPFTQTHFLVLIRNNNYNIRNIEQLYVGINEAYPDHDRNKFRNYKVSED
jgi:hypothetical protein